MNQTGLLAHGTNAVPADPVREAENSRIIALRERFTDVIWEASDITPVMMCVVLRDLLADVIDDNSETRAQAINLATIFTDSIHKLIETWEYDD